MDANTSHIEPIKHWNKTAWALGVVLPRTLIAALLFSIFALSFILTPVWNLSPSIKISMLLLILFVFGGVIWSAVSSSALPVHFIHRKTWIALAILLVIILVLNYRELSSGLPWRGDESFHVDRAIIFIKIIVTRWKWMVLGCAALVLFLFLAWVRPRWGVMAGIFLLLGTVYFVLIKQPFKDIAPNIFLRYPVLISWLSAIPPAISKSVINPYQEILFRVLPFLSAVGIAWIFQNNLSFSSRSSKLIWGVAIATIPLIFYYSSILYLEMPAVFLMAVVCFRIDDLLYSHPTQLKQNIAWYCLILIGFIKETTIPFLGCFLIARWIVQLLKKKGISTFWNPALGQSENERSEHQERTWIRWLLDEFAVTFSVLFPLLLYLILRSMYTNTRVYKFHWQNFFDPRVYSALAHSLVDQFGIFLLVFVLGWILLLKQKEYLKTTFILMIFLADPMFHIVDSWRYVGYSRFNLFLIPPILIGTAAVVEWLYRRKKTISVGLACLAMLVSLAITPINPDGTKKPFWDSYNTDTAEHYYPYREAIIWLQSTDPNARVLSAGTYSQYYFSFYAHQLKWKIQGKLTRRKTDESYENNAVTLQRAIDAAEKDNYQIILFQPLGKDIPDLPNASNFELIKIIQNSAHFLLIYGRVIE